MSRLSAPRERPVPPAPRKIAQSRFLASILAGLSVADASREIKRTTATGHKWLRDPNFQALLERHREDALRAAEDLLRGNARKAVSTLAALMDHADPWVQMKAAMQMVKLAGLLPEDRHPRPGVAVQVNLSASPVELAAMLMRARELTAPQEAPVALPPATCAP